MNTKTAFPRAIRTIEHLWIPMADGSRLAARIWLPADAEHDPVPAILEYIPYRKNDGTVTRDALMHPYFAGHGYAALRVDMRGSGDSDGIMYDEYLKQEQDDALDVLAWLAGQSWCTGAVGIIGKSWGGFNGLQIAARRPAQLQAVISVCSTDDRYADDVHYMGGCLLAADMLPWASTMLAYNALPPDPGVVGEEWRAMWHKRLAQTPPFAEAWVDHQRRDAFWRHGSVCEDFAAITCPVYAVGGWADAYTNAIPRLLEGLSSPSKGLIGPWAHLYPHQGVPGPAIGFLQECVRWWDHWLKGRQTGIMEEPRLRVWMQDAVEPRPFYAQRPGRWVAEPSWPAPRIQPRRYVVGPGTLDEVNAPAVPAAVATRLDCTGLQESGVDAGAWCPYALPTELPPDQRAEDGRALSFTSAPLSAPMEILGFPEATLSVAVDRPCALLAVRLCDVAPTGVSTLVTRGLLNLTHRDSHEQPTPLTPGQRYTVTVRLNAIAHALPAGHRWRLAISPTYWPWAWPSPEPVTVSVFAGHDSESSLMLPLRPTRAEDATLPEFAPAEGAPPAAVEILHRIGPTRTVERDAASGRVTLTEESAEGYRVLDSGREYDGWGRNVFTIVEGDPLSASVRCDHRITVARGEWRVRVETRSTMSADATQFYLTNAIDAYEGAVRVHTTSHTRTLPRDLV